MSDKDSLMAMEALLKFRSDSFAEKSTGVTTTTKAPSPIIAPRPHLPVPPSHFLPVTVLSNPSSFVLPAPSPPLAQQVVVPYTIVDQKQSTLLRAPEKSPEDVRKEQIEAALRSKPQRGKKRDNLSAMERLELTRTRNREHAKSTRIRKKARHQELMEKETQLQALQESQALNNARVATMAKFLECREKMLLASQGIQETVKALADCVHELSSFTFESSSVKHEQANDIGSMDELDESIRSRAIAKFGSCEGIRFCVVGGNDSIAISKAGTSMIHIDLIRDDSVILSAFAKSTFAPNSEKIASFQWFTLRDTLKCAVVPSSVPPPPQQRPAPAKVEAGPPKLIAFQQCYPSVVSFDPSHHIIVDAEKTRSTEEGPGMNI